MIFLTFFTRWATSVWLLVFCLSMGLPASAAPSPADCDSCRIQVDNLATPVKLSGRWLFTRDDATANKDINADLSNWVVVKTPGPWKRAYNDGRNFSVGWYRGNLIFDPSLVGQEVVLLLNTYMARTQVWIDGQPVYARPANNNVERYYSTQAIPIRFKISSSRHVIAMRVDTPLMTGVYQMPFEIRQYRSDDHSLTAYQFIGGDLRLIVGFAAAFFGLFFLLVYKKTGYAMYLTASLGTILYLPFAVAPTDVMASIFKPENLVYVSITGLTAIYFIFIFCQYFSKFMPRTNWVLGVAMGLMGLAVGSMTIVPNLNVFQALRTVLLATLLLAGCLSVNLLVRSIRDGRHGVGTLLVSVVFFLLCGVNDVLLALGVISSISMVFIGITVFTATMLYLASLTFANTFLQNKHMARDLKALNENLEQIVADRTEQLRQKTIDIQSMLQNLPQGVMTITAAGKVHPEYAAYLETIFASTDIAGQDALSLIFSNANVGSDALSQVEAAVGSCIGEDRMNFEFNGHVLVTELEKTMVDGAVKSLELSWSPICDEQDTVEKLMVCIRDVTEVKRLVKEAGAQKRELEMIGQVLAVSQEKYNDFTEGALKFLDENRTLISQAADKHPDLIGTLFRNMHTIKGNARTYGLIYMTNLVHETEQAYDELRKDDELKWDPEHLLGQLGQVEALIQEYKRINDVVLGRKGAGRRGNVDKFLMVERDQIGDSLRTIDSVDQDDLVSMRAALAQVGRTLNLIGTERLENTIGGLIASLPSLAQELGKEPPIVHIDDRGIVLRNQISGLLRNLFTHLLRNAVDHGLEVTDQRIAAGKPAAGRIDLDVSMDTQNVRIRLRDDGRGIAIGKIRARALDKGLLTEEQARDDQTVAMMIFASGFSTAEQVTEVSGRGVGMDAVKGFIEAEGGRIEIHFTDQPVAPADFRTFELCILLPKRFAFNGGDAVRNNAHLANGMPASLQ